MASLLPHKTLGYKPDGGVTVDGKLAQGFEQRHECLSAVGGMAIKHDDLMAKKRDEGREAVKASKVVYVYHDTIDATGDKQASEKETLHAVRRALNEIAALVSHVINNLNAHLVLVTADHGFLFTESTASETDKSAIEHQPQGTVLSKRRYLLGTKLPDDSRVWHGSTAVSARAEGGMEFWLPRGVNRFRFTGGSRYAHGGAMLQEIVVPVVTVRHIRGKAAEDTKTKTVAVHVLGGKHKVTTARHRFELIQMEPISERVQSAKLRIAIYEGDEAVTNVETVTFDSTSGNMDERKKWVSLVLKDRQYDKKTPYRLVLRDADTGVEQQSADVTIDRAFSDDF
ncbi:MAG: BREX-1 system phosphatase PglZ type A [Tepidisphaeraceae bacterium]